MYTGIIARWARATGYFPPQGELASNAPPPRPHLIPHLTNSYWQQGIFVALTVRIMKSLTILKWAPPSSQKSNTERVKRVQNTDRSVKLISSGFFCTALPKNQNLRSFLFYFGLNFINVYTYCTYFIYTLRLRLFDPISGGPIVLSNSPVQYSIFR